MSFAQLIKKNESVFESNKEVNYFFMPSKEPSDFLIVIFSAFNGKEAEGYPPSYNYVKPINKINCNRLFILDSINGHPSYYLGENKLLDYEESVSELIFKIADEQKIIKENIITCGSSKGGTAALYYGIKYNFGHIVTGGFQFKVGDYLYNASEYTREHVLKLITGGTSESHRDYLNDFYLDFISNADIKSKLYIHGGSGDPHYKKHVTPVLNILKQKNIPFHLDVREYFSHSEIAPYFTEFILEIIPRITNTIILKDALIENPKKKRLQVTPTIPEFFKDKKLKYAYYIYFEDQKDPIKKIMYSSKSKLVYKVKKTGRYKVKVFIKHENQKFSVNTETITI